MALRILLCAIWAISAGVVEARTWFVERDGSGDFAVIQDAVNAATSGDSIRIGPGRFNEGTLVRVPGWTEIVRILVTVEDLTLIGAGSDQTIIGQEQDWDLSQGGHRGIQTATYWGTRRLVVENMRFENMTYAINDDDIAEMYIRNCAFSGNRYSVGDSGGVLEIENSHFLSVKRDGLHIAAWAHDRLRVTGCSFQHIPDGLWAQESVSIMGVQNAKFVDCNFRGGAGGFSAASGSRSVLRNCYFDGQSALGISSLLGCSLVVRDCGLKNQGLAFDLASDWELNRVSISNARGASLRIVGSGLGSAHDCFFDKGARYVIGDPYGSDKGGSSDVHYDMRNNWWGTDNPDSIRAWIYDADDNPEYDYVIDWEPYTGQPVGEEKKSLGGVKAMFR